jgi:hypothetical protein
MIRARNCVALPSSNVGVAAMLSIIGDANAAERSSISLTAF